MNARVVAVGVFAAALFARSKVLADPGPPVIVPPAQVVRSVDTSSGGDFASLNQHLAALTSIQPIGHAPLAARIGRPAHTGALQLATAPRPIRIAPAILELAMRYNRAERILHYRGHGVNADFWGAFDHGRGMYVRYSVRF